MNAICHSQPVISTSSALERLRPGKKSLNIRHKPYIMLSLEFEMPRRKFTNAELQILSVLWTRGPSTVREIHERARSDTTVGYTTTLKQMQRMERKRLISRIKTRTRASLYVASVKSDHARSELVDELIFHAFQNSQDAFMLHALGHITPSKQGLIDIRRLLDSMEGKAQ